MTGQGIKKLGVFPKMDDLPVSNSDIARTFQLDLIKRVICCALGPEGTNIAQASRQWLKKTNIVQKSQVLLGATPEACLETARAIQEEGIVAIFWTCAVYSRESQFFFGNPDVFPFFIQEPMFLDDMQLATRRELVFKVKDGIIPDDWSISSHSSPQHLLSRLGRKIILVNSNAAAAQHCASGQSQACITTESARKIHQLVKLHSFGSPLMIFFGGITQYGANIVRKIFQSV